MLKNVVGILALLFLVTDTSSGQAIYKPERGIFAGLTTLSGAGNLDKFLFDGEIGYRFTPRLDAALRLRFDRDVVHPSSPSAFALTKLLLNPTFGHTIPFKGTTFGLRTALSPHVAFWYHGNTIDVAGYGGVLEASLYRQINLFRGIQLLPSIGVEAGVFHRTDTYRLLDTPSATLASPPTGTDFAYGPVVKLPISFKVFGNKRLIFEPTYQHRFWRGNKNGVGDFGGRLRFNF